MNSFTDISFNYKTLLNFLALLRFRENQKPQANAFNISFPQLQELVRNLPNNFGLPTFYLSQVPKMIEMLTEVSSSFLGKQQLFQYEHNRYRMPSFRLISQFKLGFSFIKWGCMKSQYLALSLFFTETPICQNRIIEQNRVDLLAAGILINI